MQQFWGLRGNKLNAAIWTISCFCIIIFAYNAAVAGGALVNTSFQRQFPQIDTIDATPSEEHSRATIQGTVISLFTLLGTFGALACTILGDVWGRRWTIWFACATNLIGVIIMGSSFSFAQFIVSRIVVGFGTGGIIATTSVWQAEISKPASRGSHVSGFGIFAGIGLALAAWIDYGCSHASGSFSWRFPFLIQMIFPITVMALIHTLPESPRWLVKMERIPEAREVFSAVYEQPTDSETVNKMITDIELSISLGQHSRLRDLFKMGPQRTLHRLMLAAIIQMYLQMTGVNAITYYAAQVYELYLGFTVDKAQILSSSAFFVVILGSCVCSFTVDRYGRRALMLTSSIGMVICQVCLAGLVSQQQNAAALKAAVFFMFTYYLVYTLGFLGLPFLYASEVAPVHLRGAVCGISTAVSWLFNFLVAEITPVAFADIGYQYFIVFAAINASAIPVVYFFYPETAGRSLEEIDEIFAASKSIFDTVKVAQKLPHGQHLSEFLVEEGKLDAEAEKIEKV